MTTKEINYNELARSTDGFNCAQVKAVCVEAGMCALRRGASFLNHEDYVDGIAAVEAKKKEKLDYFAWFIMYIKQCLEIFIVKYCNDRPR